MSSLPPNVYTHSYLLKAGVRFTPNLVDTVVKKGFGRTFWFYVLISLISGLLCFFDSSKSIPYHYYLHVILSFGLILCSLYTFKYLKYRHIRKSLRVDNPAIVVEAYAVVLFDLASSNPDKVIKPKKSAVLYKECGSKKPRFFTGCIRNDLDESHYKEQLARVFVDRKNEKLYTVDDDMLYSPVSEKLDEKVESAFEIQPLEPKLQSQSN